MIQRSPPAPNSGSKTPRGRMTVTPLRQALRALLFAAILLVAWSITFIFYPSPDRVVVIVGEPSPRDIKAPRQVIYESEVKTTETFDSHNLTTEE